MFSTTEVRWFYEGTIPNNFLEWFDKLGPANQQETRDDYYLSLPGNHSLGIKLREGKLEIKQRIQEHGILQLNSIIGGAVESWIKWSFELNAAPNQVLDNIYKGTHWIRVKKERKTIWYSLSGNQVIITRNLNVQDGQGCVLELTQIRVWAKYWWSLAFESFGDKSLQKSTLIAVMQNIFEKGATMDLDVRSSFGYPRLLADL